MRSLVKNAVIPLVNNHPPYVKMGKTQK